MTHMQPTTEPVRCSSAAERMRLHRERRRLGLRCLVVELHATEIDTLIRMGLLKRETSNDRNAVIKALYAFFDCALNPKP